ncbi:BrnT family toxin [Candidatus Hamiltonella defensa]|uniref:BrnT family toxin n=1 Tax=Candidatus Williamhamiltonella defendens TaxID=138072 RepID=A0AAC9VIS3_9ENTR|nr:BrnT family toxin [Candidatus Hamiltonella defensa]ASV33066.1 hypothetical protein CJJ18_01895 [Candidatus Hamiltonella defensa]AWK16015.1 hypothetical protein CCS40_01875 [Candidatus Hamiltonella defensa]MBK4362306.1 BrnT family toxin [Candidatus Hamiltonella defensa]
MKIKFEWDPVKAERNIRKHKVSFELATRVFIDPFALMGQDRIEHGEHRWQTIGSVEGHFLVLIAHTVYDDDDGFNVIRLISARKTTKKERNRYEQKNNSL